MRRTSWSDGFGGNRKRRYAWAADDAAVAWPAATDGGGTHTVVVDGVGYYYLYNNTHVSAFARKHRVRQPICPNNARRRCAYESRAVRRILSQRRHRTTTTIRTRPV